MDPAWGRTGMRVLAEIEAGEGAGAAGVFYKSGYPRSTRAAKTGFMQDSLAAAVVTRSLTMANEVFVQCRVSQETKSLLQTAAAQKGVSESVLLRQLLETVLGITSSSGFSVVTSPSEASGAARLYIRRRPDDRALLAERAARRGLHSATYVSVLVRSHLRHLAPLPKEELASLKRSVAELGAIGRSLNQIARAANQGAKVGSAGSEGLRAMLKVAEGLRDHVKALIKANRGAGTSRNGSLTPRRPDRSEISPAMPAGDRDRGHTG
jgi:uncharacterized protein (DUF1778 family)